MRYWIVKKLESVRALVAAVPYMGWLAADVTVAKGEWKKLTPGRYGHLIARGPAYGYGRLTVRSVTAYVKKGEKWNGLTTCKNSLLTVLGNVALVRN